MFFMCAVKANASGKHFPFRPAESHLLSRRHSLNEPRMPALLVSHGRPGFCVRVLQEGEVEAGDEIFKAPAGPGGMSAWR